MSPLLSQKNESLTDCGIFWFRGLRTHFPSPIHGNFGITECTSGVGVLFHVKFHHFIWIGASCQSCGANKLITSNFPNLKYMGASVPTNIPIMVKFHSAHDSEPAEWSFMPNFTATVHGVAIWTRQRKFNRFLPRDAMHPRYYPWACVGPSVCPCPCPSVCHKSEFY